MMARRQPRRLASAIREARGQAEPRTLLGAVQSAWSDAAGEGVASEATPVAEREGVVTVACRSATWAQELDLMQDELLSRLQRTLFERRFPPPDTPLKGLRFTADAPRHFRP